jgi:hypothetical protein
VAEVIRALLIFTAAMVAFIVGGTVITQTPLEAVAWLVLLVEVVPLATFAFALQLRKMMRPKSRGDWQHMSADHVDRLPTPHAVAEIVAPQQPQIAAPQMEVSQWHSGD